MSQTQAAPQITGKMFMFERPELLNRDQHGDLGVGSATKPFDFCTKVRAVPLTISEIPEAIKYYPVIFMSQQDPVPLAVVGLHTDFNLFVDDQGNWDQGAYIPGYVRRYPFALAGESGGDRMALVIDRAYEGVSPDGASKLFDNGEMSEFVRQAMEFARTYETDKRLTEQVMAGLKEFEIIQTQTAQFTPTGTTQPRPFAQYAGVDEQKLRELPDDRFLELRRRNVLPILYAHLISLSNWRNLLVRRMRRFNLSETDAIGASVS